MPYGVDLERFEKVGEPSDNHFDVLFVGAVSFQKGVPYILKAFADFDHPNKRLRIVGERQPEMDQYLHDHPPLETVELLEPIPQPRLKEIMSRSHVMVLPSIQEGLALVQEQAMACRASAYKVVS